MISLGVLIGIQVITKGVISDKADVSTSAGKAIYNLFDYIIPYTFSAFVSTCLLLIVFIALKLKLRKDKQKLAKA